LVANLPYNVATPLVMRVLTQAPQITSILVMVQLEVAERMAARPGDEAYGSVSARLSLRARAELVGKVPASVFVPAPKVASGLVSIQRLDEPAVAPEVASEAAVDKVIATAFAQRRKMLRRSLASLLSEADFEAAGVDSSRRPEELGVLEFGALASQLS
jgi:16S rRNA (adenine1518-N6/adenine1519-N6)-dimethyltransferase